MFLASQKLPAAKIVEFTAVHAQQTQNICITFMQRRPNVEEVETSLYKCYTNVLCLLDIGDKYYY